MILPSFTDDYRAAVFGAAGGIGAAMVRALSFDPRCAVVYAGARHAVGPDSTKVRAFRFDLEDEASIGAAAETCSRLAASGRGNGLPQAAFTDGCAGRA